MRHGWLVAIVFCWAQIVPGPDERASAQVITPNAENAQQQTSPREVTGRRITVEPAAVTTWDDIVAHDEAQSLLPPVPKRVGPRTMPPPVREWRQPRGTFPPIERPPIERSGLRDQARTPRDAQPVAERTVLAGPSGGASFMALGDNNDAIPPDTMGAVGPTRLMTMLNTQVRIQNKSGGVIGATVSLQSFWSSTGCSDVFDPRLVYDQQDDRWLATCSCDRDSASSAVLFAISDTSDPAGGWTFYSIDADPGNVDWADFGDIGFNNTWIAITSNMFQIGANPDVFSGAAMWVIDKSTALAGGSLTITSFPTGFDVAGGADGFALRPCVTFGNHSTLYVVDSSGYTSGGVALLRISRIIGSGPSPSWSVLPGSVFFGSGLFEVDHNFHYFPPNANQQGTAALIEVNDARLLNAVFRNGRIWTVHHGGRPNTSPNRAVLLWYQLIPSLPNPIDQSGILNGGVGVFYIYPSIAVNANDDVCIGFSRSDSSRFVEAVHTGRLGGDPDDTLDPISVLKAGEDSYIKDFGTGRIRWGDYSATAVDPDDDLTLWTIQQYAESDVGPFPDNDRWGTWWGQKIVGTPCSTVDECCPLTDVCQFDVCSAGFCGSLPTLYGDVSGLFPSCVPDGSVNATDILAILNNIQGLAGACEDCNLDINGVGPLNCQSDGAVNATDILGILNAIQGLQDCGCN